MYAYVTHAMSPTVLHTSWCSGPNDEQQAPKDASTFYFPSKKGKTEHTMCFCLFLVSIPFSRKKRNPRIFPVKSP